MVTLLSTLTIIVSSNLQSRNQKEVSNKVHFLCPREEPGWPRANRVRPCRPFPTILSHSAQNPKVNHPSQISVRKPQFSKSSIRLCSNFPSVLGGSVNAKAGGSSGLNNPGGPLVFHPKKPKVSGGGGAPGGSHRALGGVSGVGGPGSSASNATQPGVWESIAREIDPVDLVGAVTGALNEDPDRAVAWLCGAVRQLRALRAKPDQVLYLSLLYLAKHQPELFSANEHCVNAFCSLLKRDVKESYKSKGNALVAVLAANILLAAFQKERHWPDIFVRVFIDDAIGERIWVDHPDCKGFVDNVMTALGTRMPPQSVFLKPEGGREQCPSPPVGGGSGSGSGSATPTRVTDDDSLQGMESGGLMGSDGREPMDVGVMPRYQGVQNVIEHIVMEVVREHLNRRQGSDNITRNFLRFLTSACGLPEVSLSITLICNKLTRSLLK